MNGKLVKARKNHRCQLCEEIIENGSKYWRERLTPWDHSVNETYSTFKSHGLCYDVWCDIGDDCDWEFPNDSAWFKEQITFYLQEKNDEKNNG